MEIQNFHFLLLAIALLCDSSFSNSTEANSSKKNDTQKSKQKRFGDFPILSMFGQPGQSNVVQTWSSSSFGGNSSSSPQIINLLNDPSFQNSFSTGSQVKSETMTAPDFFAKQFSSQIPQSQDQSWSVSLKNVGGAGGSLENIMNSQFPLGQNAEMQKVIKNVILQNQGNGANDQSSQGSWAVLMNSSNVPIGEIPIQTGFDENYTIQKLLESFNLANNGNGANPQSSQGSWVVIINSSNVPHGQNTVQNGFSQNSLSFANSMPVSTLTTQITTEIDQILVPFLQKYLSPIKSEATGTKQDILIVLLPKLQQLTNDLSNLKTQLSISGTSSSPQVPTVVLTQLTNVLSGLQSSVNNLKNVAQEPDDGSNQLPETLLKPLSNIQQNLNQLQPVLQVIKPSQGPTPQVVDGKKHSGPVQPNLNVDSNSKNPNPQIAPFTNGVNWNPLNPNLNVDSNSNGPIPLVLSLTNGDNSAPLYPNPNVENNRKTNPTPVTNTVKELNRLADNIPVTGSEPLNEAVTTAEKLDSQLSSLQNFTLTQQKDQPKEHEKEIQRALLKVTLKIDDLKKGPLEASSDWPKYSNPSVLTFSMHSTQIVLSLVNLFKFYFGVNFPTTIFDGQALSTTVVELLSTTATNLQLLLPYARDLSQNNNGKLMVSYQDDVDRSMNNIFSSLIVLMPYLSTVTSELTSGAPHLDQPKDLPPTVTNVIVNFELTYPYYANILRTRAEQSPQLLNTNRNLYNMIALAFLVQLHKVPLAATEFHSTVSNNIVPQFTKFVSVIVSFDLTFLKGSPGSTDLSANLQLLLPYVRQISETKSSSAKVALNAIFALLRIELNRLSQTLNAKTLRSSFSSITFTKESTAFLTQFSNMFKNLDLLLSYLDVNNSQKSASGDFLPFTIADFKFWFSQAHQVVLDALKKLPVEAVKPRKKRPGYAGYISFRDQPNLESHSAEEVSS